jgi:hypothetical protein
VGLLAVVICWLALRRQAARAELATRGSRLARWGLRLGMLKLLLFIVFLTYATVNSFTSVAL